MFVKRLRTLFVPTNLFYSYYDLLFAHKDYSKETELCLKLSNRYGIKNPTKILEIGCGTGNHTLNLAQTNKEITAIDTDQEMINLAAKKVKASGIKNIKLLKSKVEDLKNQKFDLVIAMFNVITYIEEFDELEDFINGVSNVLRQNGVFIFDCWNGVAAMVDPPNVKKISLKHQDEELSLIVTPEVNLFKQLVNLTYDFRVKSKKSIKSSIYILPQKLWTPDEISWVLTKARFETKVISPLFNINKKATEKDWKILFCARKIG